MSDIKILHFLTCMIDQKSRPVLVRQGVNTSLTECTDLEAMLLPYLNQGYKITHFSANNGADIIVVLERG